MRESMHPTPRTHPIRRVSWVVYLALGGALAIGPQRGWLALMSPLGVTSVFTAHVDVSGGLVVKL